MADRSQLSLQGEIATDLGELDRGEMLGRQGIQLAWAIGERRYFAGALAGLARTLAAAGDLEGEPASMERWRRCWMPPVPTSP